MRVECCLAFERCVWLRAFGSDEAALIAAGTLSEGVPAGQALGLRAARPLPSILNCIILRLALKYRKGPFTRLAEEWIEFRPNGRPWPSDWPGSFRFVPSESLAEGTGTDLGLRCPLFVDPSNWVTFKLGQRPAASGGCCLFSSPQAPRFAVTGGLSWGERTGSSGPID